MSTQNYVRMKSAVITLSHVSQRWQNYYQKTKFILLYLLNYIYRHMFIKSKLYLYIEK